MAVAEEDIELEELKKKVRCPKFLNCEALIGKSYFEDFCMDDYMRCRHYYPDATPREWAKRLLIKSKEEENK